MKWIIGKWAAFCFGIAGKWCELEGAQRTTFDVLTQICDIFHGIWWFSVKIWSNWGFKAGLIFVSSPSRWLYAQNRPKRRKTFSPGAIRSPKWWFLGGRGWKILRKWSYFSDFTYLNPILVCWGDFHSILCYFLYRILWVLAWDTKRIIFEIEDKCFSQSQENLLKNC